MPPRFDGDRAALTLSVADLLDARLARHLGFSQRGGYERMWLGQAIHSRYQEQALEEDPGYRSEVAVALTFPQRGWEITIQGRIDGLRRQEGLAIVEEIKSVRRGGQLPPATREIYEQQAALYAWMLHRRGEREVAAELVLIEIGSEEVERERLEIDFESLERSVTRRINRLIASFEKERAAAAERRAAAAGLSFPYPSMRPGQQEIVDRTELALERGEHLLVQAPTGLGKTVAALYPALRHALAREQRVFVLTAKTLQQEMATAVLELLNHEGAFRSLRLRAKAKMCANDELLCHEEYCAFARDYYSKLLGSDLLERLVRESTTLLPEAIHAAARGEEVCPFEVSLELTQRCQVVVCDYNYAFDPYVALSDFGADSDLSNTVLVIDEIHNLVERGRGYYSPSLAAPQALAAAESLEAGARATPVMRAAGLCRELAQLIEEAVEGALLEHPPGAGAAEAALPEEELWALRSDFDEAFIAYLEHRRETSTFRAEDPFVSLYFDLLRFLNGILWSEGATFSHCVERRPEGGQLRVLCKDPSRFLGRVLNRAYAAIGLSATLTPSQFYRDLLGFDPERTSQVEIPSPFPAENRRVVIDATVATTWRERPDNYPRIAENLGRFAESVPGNCLVLFPSYDFLKQVAKRLRAPGKRVLVQERAASDGEREEMLETLRSSLLGDVLLLAVAGGVFAEGVDYPGEMLRAVAVVGPCLPAVSLEQELLKHYYQERFERGFEYAFVVPGMTRVVQAAGRLIRSSRETGVIALLDRRFLAAPYRHHLPADWLPPEGPEGLVGDPGEEATRFFSGSGDLARSSAPSAL